MTTSQPTSAREERGGRNARSPWAIASDVAYRYSVIWALVVCVAIFSILEPDTFFTLANAQSILGSQAILLLIALGLTIPLAANEFDLSVAAVAGFSQVILGTLAVKNGWPLSAALVMTLGICAAIGAFNAFLVVKVGVNSFITTLGMGTLLTGIAIKVTNSATIPGIPESLTEASASDFLGLDLVFWYGVAAAVLLWYVLAQTPLGRWLYFTGASPDVARLNGIPVNAIRAGTLIASATVAGLAGVLYAGVYGAADPFSGDSFLLPAFAAAFLGATAFTPGRFNAWGTFFSVYLVITGIVGLSLVTEEVGWISHAFNGGILIVAVAFQRIVAMRRSKSSELL